MTAKALALDLIRDLPDDVTFGEIVETLALADAIRLGEEGADAGRFVTHEDVKRRVADLIAREKTTGLVDEETRELDAFLRLEHLMRLTKARARRRLGDQP
jgi:hypothetical protein